MSKDAARTSITAPITKQQRQAEDLAAALMLATLDGYDDIAELLQRGRRQRAFFGAVRNGYTDIVELLLPYVNPEAQRCGVNDPQSGRPAV